MTVRTQGISGTEIAALFGMSPYATPFSVYARKKGLVPDLEQTPRMRMGKLLEPVVVQLFEEDTNKSVSWSDRLMEHPKEPLVIGTPDGFVNIDESVFESKTAGLDRAFEWGDEGDQVPQHYLFQCQYYMMLTGTKQADLAVLIGGNDFRRFELTADEELQALMLDEVRRFWRDHIEKNVPPEIDYTNEAKQYLMQRYPSPTEGIRDATSAEDELVIGIIQTRKELKFLEERKETLQNKLKDSIGLHKGLQSIHGKVSWTHVPGGVVQSFERKPSRRMTITGKRGEAE
jgi:putative phage-type endonuclease